MQYSFPYVIDLFVNFFSKTAGTVKCFTRLFRLCEPARPFFQCAKKCLRVFTIYTGSREKPKRKIKLQKPRKDLTHFFGEWVPCLTSDVSREPVLCSRWFVEYAMWAACSSLVAHFLLPATASVGRRLQLHACRVLTALPASPSSAIAPPRPF